jgi:hypothetical protein
MFQRGIMQLSLISEIICKTAVIEDQELSDISNEGIFHMPELAFAYQCGKAIMKEAKHIFGNTNTLWLREENLGNGGPTDLVFKLDNGEILAIEFKLRDTTDAYEKDIVKLCKINNPKVTKLFCALIDVFESKLPDDGRQKHVESLPEYKVIPIKKHSFNTSQKWYKSQVSCVVCIWSVGIQSVET